MYLSSIWGRNLQQCIHFQNKDLKCQSELLKNILGKWMQKFSTCSLPLWVNIFRALKLLVEYVFHSYSLGKLNIGYGTLKSTVCLSSRIWTIICRSVFASNILKLQKFVRSLLKWQRNMAWGTLLISDADNQPIFWI